MQSALECVVNRQLGKAVNLLENYLYTFVQPQATEQLEELKTDYQLMAEYWQRGFEDPERERLYDKLLHRMYVLVSNEYIRYYIKNSSFAKSVYDRTRAARKDWSPNAIRQDMESFVTDAAMLELEPEHTRQQRQREVYEKHQKMMADLFDYIWTSRLWNSRVTEAFEDMLLSPTIDLRDQQLLVSAITVSLINFFDISKFRLLMHVYQKAPDEHVRQRALIGWVMGIDTAAARLYPEVGEMVKAATTDSRCIDELAELQMQTIYCLRAESDTQIIQSEIMPELIKNNNIRVTRNGIEEAEDDPMEDVLHPEIAEQRMEKLEESMRRMVDMQKQGSDIYFGGFSQMKRFPFFGTVGNWFLPFFLQHPAVDGAMSQTRGKKFLLTMLKHGPFCDSDKYSFVLAFQTTVSKLPESMLAMMDRGEATLVGSEINVDEVNSPAFIRRSYLQSVYRFFRVFHARNQFCNPFDVEERSRLFFFANPLFQDTPLEKKFHEVAAFFMKHKVYEAAKATLQNYREEIRDEQFYLLNGNLLMRTHWQQNAGLTASESLAHCLELNPENERAWTGYARTLFGEQNYEKALHYYRKLEERHADNQNYQLNEAVCLTNMKRNEDALKILFKLNYESPEDINTNRVLAWTLVGAKRYEQAKTIYESLLDTEKPAADDLMNAAYMHWFCGDRTAAINLFRKYSHMEGIAFDATTEFLTNEKAMLNEHGISDVEIRLMIDQLL